jgi:hypothetical protein
MARARDRIGETATELLTMLILGLGFLDLFLGVVPGVEFWMIWVIGFAVVLPIVAILLDVDDEGADRSDASTAEVDGEGRRDRADPDEGRDDSTRDAIETLRDRYARGDLTDEQFERKLDRLLETDSPESAADWRRDRERDRERERT